MFRFLIVACLAVAIQGASLPALKRYRNLKSVFPSGKIVGGQDTTIDQVPWQVALENYGVLFCGGSILSANYILTAAHCVEQIIARDITIRTGSSILQKGGSVIQVSSLTKNPGFTATDLDYDVAVLKLNRRLTFDDNTQAVTLRKQEAAGGETGLIAGWGTTVGAGTFAENLQSVQVPLVDHQECSDAYNGDITERMICAGASGKDACLGDTGGPITVDGVQVGIISWGYGCAEPDYPSVYANVPALADFINKNSNNEAQWV